MARSSDNIRRPSVLFITTDTQGWEMVSANRPGVVDTPNVDALARRGVLFENAFTAAPICTPARSAWYTGMPPNRNGAICNDAAVSRGAPHLAELLSQRGYQCHHVGKWHLDAGGYEGRGRADGGFAADTWYDLANFYAEVGTDGPNKFGGWNRGLDDVEYCFGHRVADRAIELLRRLGRADEPFLLAAEFDEPHGPYICPPPFRGRYAAADIPVPPTRTADLSSKPRLQQEYAAWLAGRSSDPARLPDYYRRYYDCTSYVDFEIGRVLEAAARYAGEDLLIVFTSDHGDHLGAFGLAAKGPTMYDHTTRVPFIVAGPQVVRPGRRSAALTTSTDLFATVAALCDAAPVERASGGGAAAAGDAGAGPAAQARISAAGYTGASLLPVLSGATEAHHDAIFIEYNRFGVKFDQCRGFYPIRCIRTDRWKLSVNLVDTDELYDLYEDPEETDNRMDDPAVASVRDDLHDRLLAQMTATQDLLRGPQWLERAWRDAPAHRFVGLQTTGAAEQWADGRWEV